MNNRIIEYAIRVLSVLEKGHPVQRITYSFHDASKIYDQFRESYPQNEIVIIELSEKEIARFVPKKPPQPITCSRGHSGLIDGKSVIFKQTNGVCYCTVCGDFFTAPAQ